MIKTLCLTASVLSFVVPTRCAVAQESPPINKIAHHDGSVPGNTTYRAVELQTPWVYALDRDGDLHVYKIPGNKMRDCAAGFRGVFAALFGLSFGGAAERPAQRLQLMKTIDNAGDGNDLEIMGDVLALTSRGKLAVFNLAEPSNPTKVGEFGPESATDSQSIVRAGEHVFVLGSDNIASFDISQPKAPKHLATLKNDNGNWNGCYDGRFLYVSEISRRPKNRTGVAVYGVTNPKALTERHFVQTERAAYHVFVNNDRYLFACLDSESRFHFVSGRNITVAGSTQMFELDDKNAPKSVSITKSSGGRSAVATNYRDTTIMICNGLAFTATSKNLRKIYSFFPDGSTLDGFPYHGDHFGQHAALATDHAISVFEIGDSRFYSLGKHIALALIIVAVP